MLLASCEPDNIFTVFYQYEGSDDQRPNADGKGLSEERNEQRDREGGNHGAQRDVFPFVHHRNEQQEGYQAGYGGDGQVNTQGGRYSFSSFEPFKKGKLVAQEGRSSDGGNHPGRNVVRAQQVLTGQKYG